MADEDIYGNKRKYMSLSRNWARLLEKPSEPPRRGVRKYYCRNGANLAYFEKLHRYFQARDLSYVRRLRVASVLLFLVHWTDKDLSYCTREDVDALIARGHEVYLTPASKIDFLKAVKLIWRTLFPVLDEQGLVDETLVPHPVRHLSCRVEKSSERLRNDRLSFEEAKSILVFFSAEPRMQAYVALALESLGRPQEICYTRIRDVELHDGHAKVWVSEHGKEGAKFLQCIDSYPYLLRWLDRHPFLHDTNAYLFCCDTVGTQPMVPATINKHLRRACEQLGIDKAVTAYSLKRNGVTFGRRRGDSDLEIQHRAGWTSTKQLQTYDLSTPEDAYAEQLAKRGLANQEREEVDMSARTCVCGALVGFASRLCPKCYRVVDGRRGFDLPAEPELRRMLALVLERPGISLAEALDEWGKVPQEAADKA